MRICLFTLFFAFAAAVSILADTAILYALPSELAALKLFDAADEACPTNPWTNVARLELAITRFRNGEMDRAMEIANRIISTSSGTDKNELLQETYWAATFVSGRCMELQGETQEGRAMMDAALSHVPDLKIQQRLR